MIKDNLLLIQEKIRLAEIKAGRKADSVKLMAVSKFHPVNEIQEAIASGQNLFGENRVQEMLRKKPELHLDGVDKHLIGHLQTNKVKQVVGKVDLIQSVDSLRLLEAIDREAARQGIRQDILLEINIGQEASKTGFREDEIFPLVEKIGIFPNVCMRGLMAIPPICQESGGNLKFFQKMFHLYVDIRAKKYDNVKVDCLSMGMSEDYPDAIRCGSTMVRVGTAIFGARDYARVHQA